MLSKENWRCATLDLSMENRTNWLDQLLIELDWTPAELARAADLDSAVISNIRNDRRDIGIDTAVAIAKATNIPPEDILRRAGKLPPEPDIEEGIKKQILSEFSGLSREDKTEVLTYMRYRKNMRRKGKE